MFSETLKIKLENNSDEAQVQIMCYEPAQEVGIGKRPMVLVIPGGAYAFCSKREADPIANCFIAAGCNAAVLTYSVAPYTYPTSYLEAFTALKMIIDNADKYNTDINKLVVIGFSAGGHLAGLVGTGCNDPLILDHFGVKKDFFKLAGLVLTYPVITGGEFAHRGSFDNLLGDKKNDKDAIEAMSIQNRVTSETPKTFIWSTFEDTSVPCENTLLMVDALRKNNVPFELHIFPVGGHGLSLANELTRGADGKAVNPYVSKWMPMCLEWMKLVAPLV